MTLIEAAARLGVTPDNLRGAIKRGTLQAVKHGRDWWVEPAEVERYGRENRRTFSPSRADALGVGRSEHTGLPPIKVCDGCGHPAPAHAEITNDGCFIADCLCELTESAAGNIRV